MGAQEGPGGMYKALGSLAGKAQEALTRPYDRIIGIPMILLEASGRLVSAQEGPYKALRILTRSLRTL